MVLICLVGIIVLSLKRSQLCKQYHIVISVNASVAKVFSLHYQDVQLWFFSAKKNG